MKENKYDDPDFFAQYSGMARSVDGLAGAGEWHELQRMLSDFKGKRVLDLGCGFGWHCRYAAEHGAASVTGIDISEKMLAEAQRKTHSPVVTYKRIAIEDSSYPADSFDMVISSLVFHYIESFDMICSKVHAYLAAGGDFIFSVEHPIFSAYGTQDWYYDDQGTCLHWPVDQYFREGERTPLFLGKRVTKYHKTLTTYINTLIRYGFEIRDVTEPVPEEHMLKANPAMREELRRPMMLLISSRKK